ncbi:MAG: gliding motility-associated ABC transporter substrate-binding protein GldG [Flavobacteriales bacterium]|nr:gliding motility-associated ABC transporter substrate-binding protein GldG [Flavobacteriales bacterium]
MGNRKKHIKQFLSLLIVIIIINTLSSVWFHRFDLTKEKRFSLSETTKELLTTIDDYIYIEVYLEGEFPAGIERLSIETEYILAEFKSQNPLIKYNFINPTESTDDNTRNEIINQLFEKGLNPTTLQIKEGDGYSEKIIIPGAIVKYGAKEFALSLLKNQIANTPEQSIEQSIRELEYEFTNAINHLTNPVKPKIALISGHDELEGVEIEDLTNSLTEQYTLDKINLREFETNADGEPNLKKKLRDLTSQDLLIVVKPKRKFENIDKYFIDQYIMSGGKLIWLIDATNADMDSLSSKGTFLVQPLKDLNLNDILFKYGVRINNNLVQDISSSKIPIPTSFTNNIPKWELVPWNYFPVAIPSSNHPITRNLNAVKFDFAGSIDTVKTRTKINKTILLQTSPYTKIVNTPHEVSLQTALKTPLQEEYKRGNQALAVLLEGNFESIFKNRINKLTADLPFKENSKPTKMIVISDGDIVKNQLSRGVSLPLGYDRYEKRQYGNKTFILNAIDYLLDEDALIDIRSRELTIRGLNTQKIAKEKTFWQLINIGLPAMMIIIFGLMKQYLRRKKYEK